MTISAIATVQQYTGTGANTVLSTVFSFFVKSDVVVTQRVSATGSDTLMVLGVNYTMKGGSTAGAVGTVTPIVGVTDFTSAMVWTIERIIPLTQDLDYIENDSFPAESHELGLDRLTMQNQDREAVFDRSLRFPVADDISLTSELPNSVFRASKALTFDSSGNVTVTTLPGGVGGADADAIHDNVASEISLVTEKVSPVVADLVLIEDSAAANVKKRVQIGNLGSRVLLATHTVTNAAKLTVSSQEWDATYDVIELEVSVLALSAAALDIQPIDTGSATTTNLESNVTTHRGSRISGDDNANWRTSATYPLGTGPDDYLTGTAKFHSYNSGYLNGQGSWNYRSSAVHYSAICAMARHTTVISRNDGFDVLMSTGNITGTVRLYGLRNN